MQADYAGVVTESELQTSLADSKSRYKAWAKASHALEGKLDATQVVPPGPHNIVLVTALMYCFYELLRVLDLIEGVWNDLEKLDARD